MIGIDYLQENIDICTQFGLNVQKMDVFDLQFADESIDGIVFMEVIEHLDHPEKAIQEISRVLKPNGKLIVLFPNDRFFLFARFVFLRFKELRFDPGHVRQWNHRDMRKFLQANGFVVEKSRSNSFPLVAGVLAWHDSRIQIKS